MTGNNQFEKTSLQNSRNKRIAVTLLLVGLLLLAGGKWGWFAYIPNWMAQKAVESRQFETALWWAHLAERLSFNSGESEFIIARTLRKQGKLDEVGEHLKRAAGLGVHKDRIEREELLALAQSGEIARIQLQLDRMLIDQQGDGAEIAEAYANGLVICHRLEEATRDARMKPNSNIVRRSRKPRLTMLLNLHWGGSCFRAT